MPRERSTASPTKPQADRAKTILAPIAPLRVPDGVTTLLVFGGSFDPPHRFHVAGPLAALHSLDDPDRAWLLYVPAARSPLKSARPLATDARRLAMLRLALKGPGPRSIWTDELDRAAWERRRGLARPSYTIDTLRRLRRALPRGVRLRLLIGADQAAAFHRWKSHRALVRLAEPVVMLREPYESASSVLRSLDKLAWSDADRRAWRSRVAPVPAINISSTALRGAIAKTPPRADAWKHHPLLRHLAPEVARFIISHRLYGAGGTPRARTGSRSARRGNPA